MSYTVLIPVTDTWEHRRGHILKIERTDGSTEISSVILETREDGQC
jgi:predicted aconitase with swiveling domain